ncbi:MAG: PaaI family thioesterase [Desulfobacteraceae bacterium]|nr:PaaI family thioesterase [Desulfobacteraceae bacterium]
MLNPNPDYIKELITTVKQSPYPRHMSMALSKIQLDRAEVVLDLELCHMQPFGIVHGGVLATLIDTATFWAAFLRLPEETGLVNVDLKLNYLKPVMEGRLTAFGTCIQAGKSISYSEARVVDESAKIIAHGTSTLMALPGKGLHLSSSKFV